MRQGTPYLISAGAGLRGRKSHPEFLIGFRVFEDGVKLIKTEAKCDWARGGILSVKASFGPY